MLKFLMWLRQTHALSSPPLYLRVFSFFGHENDNPNPHRYIHLFDIRPHLRDPNDDQWVANLSDRLPERVRQRIHWFCNDCHRDRNCFPLFCWLSGIPIWLTGSINYAFHYLEIWLNHKTIWQSSSKSSWVLWKRGSQYRKGVTRYDITYCLRDYFLH